MAYPYYPQMAYQPNYYGANPFQPQYQPQTAQQAATIQQQPTPPAQPQIQNGGFISVANIEIARNWPIAPGNSVTFKDENAPYVYTKTMGFSQLDRPMFEVYRLVKEEDAVQSAQNAPGAVTAEYALKSDVDALRGVVDDLRASVDGMAKTKTAVKAKAKETEADE